MALLASAPDLNRPITEWSASCRESSTIWREMVVLSLWTAVLAFYGLNAGFLYRTEALRALVGRNMLHSGDYFIPTLYGQPLLTKGPVMYAAIAMVSRWFGDVTTWSARIPAALATLFTAWLFFWHLLRYVDKTEAPAPFRRPISLTRGQALLVACMVSCNPLWLDKATSAEIDMVLVFWVTCALVCFFRAVDTTPGQSQYPNFSSPGPATMPHRRVASYFWWALAMTAVALGALTKWHAPVFFYATAIAYLAWTGRLRWLWRGEHLAGLSLALGIIGGWIALVVNRVGWPALAETLWQQALPRLSPIHQHGERLWLQTPVHPFKMLICGLPWSLFALVTVWPRFQRRLTPATQALFRTLHCWTWPSLLVLTVLPDHDARHSMPLVVGLVGLGAAGCLLALSAAMEASMRKLAQLGLLTLLVGFTVALAASIPLAAYRLPPQRWPIAIVLGCVAGLVLVASWCSAHRQRWLGSVVGLLILWLVVKIAFADLVVPVRSIRDPVGKAAILQRHVPESETLYLFEAKDEGIMFYYNRPVLRVSSWDNLPRREQVYCLAAPRDLPALQQNPRWHIVWEFPFRDEQGDPMMLLLLQPRN